MLRLSGAANLQLEQLIAGPTIISRTPVAVSKEKGPRKQRPKISWGESLGIKFS